MKTVKSAAGGGEPKKSVKKRLKIAALICLGLALALILFDFAAASLQIRSWTHPKKAGFVETPAAHLPGLDYHTFELETPNGKITGWQIPAQQPIDADAEEWVFTDTFSDKTVVFAPNYDSNREMNDLGGLDYFASLCAAGYNVFTFDWTGSGYSDGTKNVFDLDKTEELLAVIDYAAQTSKASFIALQSAGFGCYPAACAAAESDKVDALIMDSCYDDFSDWFYGNFSDWAPISAAPVRKTVQWLFPLYSGVDIDGIAVSQPLSRLRDKRVMIIQGEFDEQFGAEDARNLATVAGQFNKTELWTVNCNHLRAYSVDPDAYVSRVTAFLASAQEPTEE